ncbi:5-deoxy-glucuronate isomerase [Mangrovactinospora gilvigrisea]|uniref:5-deoxy-glucuronate isomerase n=1 Tax=Mangrovactinospora gilvigrisea TaxID=1428644 RepID=A0A1J7BC69_9ACTN|nr:5-deoxy-glucuronate isomerase [Mangrovactinospora gilvigrisea]OIV36267.1 5-deoxy-glucuronate isomerase [Mangrovactinospora gilvigrisea]
MDRYVPSGTAARGDWAVDIDPARAGWEYSSLRVAQLPPGGTVEHDCGESEWIVLPLAGSCTVEIVDGDGGKHRFELAGRRGVFDGVSDFAYAPRDGRLRISSADGGRFALTGARCRRRLPARYGPASGVPIEIRGAGQATRQCNNFAAAGVFEADNLIAVEVITPGGNWSSFPPHKHDEDRPGEESVLEEVYYYEFADGPSADHPGLGYQRVYPSREGGTDLLEEVRGGDVVLMPNGWHGPSMALPGHHMYYLNVMAGPGDERAWNICDDPAHAWVRRTWADQAPDTRLPLYATPSA